MSEKSKKNGDYWRHREEAWAKDYEEREEYWDRQIWEIYRQLQTDMQTEIDAWIGRFWGDDGLSRQDALKKIQKVDQDYLAKRAKYLVGLAQEDMKSHSRAHEKEYFSDLANEEMAIYNTTMKISRMEMLQSLLNIHIMSATARIDGTMANALKERAEATWMNQAKVLGGTLIKNIERASTLVNASFHGATFSERLWGPHQDKLKKNVQGILARGLALGESPLRFRSQVVSECSQKGKAAYRSAARLLRTEFARVQVSAELNCMKEAGFTKYEYIVSPKCCAECAELDGKICDIKDSLSGEELPPMHPNCRCAIGAYSDRKEYEEWLDSYREHEIPWEEWEKGLNPREPWAKNGLKINLSPEEWKDLCTNSIYECKRPEAFEQLAGSLSTNKFIVTGERKQHILGRHPEAYRQAMKALEKSLELPKEVLKDKNHPNSGLLICPLSDDGHGLVAVIRIKTSNLPEEYVNSVISSWIMPMSKIEKKRQKNPLIYREGN